jgi:hypothetical protein
MTIQTMLMKVIVDDITYTDDVNNDLIIITLLMNVLFMLTWIMTTYQHTDDNKQTKVMTICNDYDYIGNDDCNLDNDNEDNDKHMRRFFHNL